MENVFNSVVSFVDRSNSLEDIYLQIRRHHRVSQEKLAQQINSCRSNVHNCENGKRDLRSSEIESLCRYHNDFRLAAIAYLSKIKSENS